MSRHHAKLNRKRWERVRLAALDRDGWRCVRCGGARRLAVHHRTPLARGGDPFDLGNVETLCAPCHWSEHRPRDPAREAWRALVRAML